MSAYELLNRRNKRFVDVYCTGCTGAAAYRIINPKHKNPVDAAWRLIREPNISAAIEEKTAEIFCSVGITQQQVIRELARIAFGNAKLLIDETGEFIPLHQLSEDAAAMIAGIEAEELYEGNGKDRLKVGRLRKVKMADKIRALEALARIGGMNRDKLEHGGTVNTLPPVIQLMTYDDADTNTVN